MKSMMRIISRYILSAAGVALILLAVNFTILAAWIIHSANMTPKDYRVANIAEELTLGDDGVYSLSASAREIISEQFQWAMFLDEAGEVVWSENLPEDVPLSYTVSDAASFSRWYLHDYPVYVWQHLNGLFVVGKEKDSVWKQHSELPMNVLENTLSWIPLVLGINALLALALALVFGLRFFHSLKPVVQGIKDMSEKKAVKLPIKGLLGSLAGDINKASAYLEKQEIALSKRDDARSTWIEGVSHDIRTPLSIVMGYASELEGDLDLPQSKREQAGIIRRQSERIKMLVNDLNLASKLEYEMQPLRKEIVPLAGLVRQVAVDFINSIQNSKYSIDVNIDKTAKNAKVMGDRELLQRAISNLLSNSIRHNPEGCGVSISLERSDSDYEIIVSDDGVGFPEEVLKNLHHLELSVEQHHIGLGLEIVHKVVKSHGGKAEFRNSIGGGCTAVLNLPGYKGTL